MKHEFLDDMLERLLVVENRTFGETFETIINERCKFINDLGRVEHAFALFCKMHPKVPKNYFRQYIKDTRPNDFEKCVNCFNWPK